MKKKVIVIILLILIVIVAIIGSIFYRDDIGKIKNIVNPINKKYEVKNNETGETKEDKIDKTTSEEVKEESKEEKSVNSYEKKNNNSSGNNKVITKSNNANKESSNTSTNISTSNANSNKSNSESGVIDPNGNAKKEEKVIVIKKQPWEEAGVSEYDWYHKPVHSWMRVDYNISKCGSISNCETLCMKDAEELAYTENVSCIQVYTYSGSYLGEMLKRN